MVVVTRGHRDDMRVLRWAVGLPLRYLGMIGSERKWISICEELEKEGVAREKLERVNSPVGLDIGAITPEEIAVAIVAEMIAVRRQRETGIQRKRAQRRLIGDSQRSGSVFARGGSLGTPWQHAGAACGRKQAYVA
jgi:xanthine dehydrogenase accessory factor